MCSSKTLTDQPCSQLLQKNIFRPFFNTNPHLEVLGSGQYTVYLVIFMDSVFLHCKVSTGEISVSQKVFLCSVFLCMFHDLAPPATLSL